MAKVVVLGASFAGLLAGAAAAGAGHDVVLLERDTPPAEAVARDGVPQGRQPHVLLHRGLLAIEELLPGIEDDLLALGGVRFNTGMMPWLGEYGWMPQRDWAYEIISLSRPLLEQAVRERVRVLPRVELRSGVTATGLRQGTSGWEVLVRDDSAVTADLVVDASGRSSRLPQWLAELGVRVPEPVVVEARVGYSSRTYRGRVPLRTGIVVASTPATQAGALALAVEDDRWLVSAVGFGDRRPGRTPADSTRSLPVCATPSWSI
jgi:2-polyprenyl-6-methoxyphenol hydroxylase-like FAD-dependent oxidoreductase